jgi:hypothetical protein
MNDAKIEALDWSPWLDFNRDNIINIAESEGVYRMHAAMKILFVGSSENLRRSLFECLSNPCISKAERFSYAMTLSSCKAKEKLLTEYRNRHDGRLPSCMEQEH